MGAIFEQSRNLPNQQGRHDGTIRGEWSPTISTAQAGLFQELIIANRKFSQRTSSFRSGIRYDDLTGLETTPGQLLRENLEKNTKSSYDTGHPFSSFKAYAYSSHGFWKVVGASGYTRYRGPLVFNTPDKPNANRDMSFGPVDLQYGTKAIKQASPTKPHASFTQFLSELLIDVPKLPGWALTGRAPNFRANTGNVGAEYLNMVFGWVPSVSDVLKICQSIVRSEDLIKQYLKDNGQPIRRKFDFAIDRSETIGGFWPLQPLAAPFNSPFNAFGQDVIYDWDSYNGYGNISKTTRTSTKYWWRGAFTYWLGDGSDAISQISSAAQLARFCLGIDGLTPELLWELTPWTWLADYFLNIGDLISNAQAFQRDNLVLRYSYLMREIHHSDIYQHSGVRFFRGHTGPITYTEAYTAKERVKGTPYGFGLNPDGFSAGQWAILAALGMTNGNRSLL